MNNQYSKYFSWLILGPIFLYGMWYLQFGGYAKDKRDALLFYNSDINARLSYVHKVGSQTSSFSAYGNSAIFHVRLVGTGKTANKFFQEFADVDDSIVKRKYSDTLYLIKDKITYYYIWSINPNMLK